MNTYGVTKQVTFLNDDGAGYTDPENPHIEQTEQIDPDLAAQFDALAIEAQGVEGLADENAAHAAPEIDTGELLLGVVSPAFDLLAPNWQVSLNEKKALATAYGALLDKYFPSGIHNQFGVELAAVAVTVTVFGSRIGVDRKQPEQEQEKAVDNGQRSD